MSSGSDDSDKSDEEDNSKRKESSPSGSEDDRKHTQTKQDAFSDSEISVTSDVEMRSKKFSEHAVFSEGISESSLTDNSDQESNRDSDSD